MSLSFAPVACECARTTMLPVICFQSSSSLRSNRVCKRASQTPVQPNVGTVYGPNFTCLSAYACSAKGNLFAKYAAYHSETGVCLQMDVPTAYAQTVEVDHLSPIPDPPIRIVPHVFSLFKTRRQKENQISSGSYKSFVNMT